MTKWRWDIEWFFGIKLLSISNNGNIWLDLKADNFIVLKNSNLFSKIFINWVEFIEIEFFKYFFNSKFDEKISKFFK